MRLPRVALWVLLFLLAVGTAAVPVRASEPPAAPTLPQPRLAPVESRKVDPGLLYRRWEGSDVLGRPLVGHTLEINLNDPGLEVVVVPAGDALGPTETVSSLAGRYGALAAINGSFFYRNGERTLPVGNLMLDGKLVAASDFLRPSLGLTADRRFLYGLVIPQVRLRTQDGRTTLALSNLNRPYQAGRLHLYHSLWGPTTGTPAGTRELILLPKGSGYTVTAVGSGNSAIPRSGLVIAGEPGLLPELPPGTTLSLEADLGAGWKNARQVLTGGPLLVEGGRPVFEAVQEGFTGTVLGRKARTAVGVKPDGRLVFLVVEGNDAQQTGVTLEEMAVLAASLGLETAVGLDGGGSSAMWVAGSLVSQPSGTQERPVANALVVLRAIPVYLYGWRLPCDTPPLLAEGRVLVPLRAIFQGLGAEVQWDPQTRQILARRQDRCVELIVGEKQARTDGRPVTLDVPARVVNGRTLVPVRFVSQALGATVQWKPEERAVYVN
ncbi:MAG: phosphodiester glycosidase family protein [Moorellales bacterium]